MGKNWKSYLGAGLIAISTGLEASGMHEYSKLVLMIGSAFGLFGVAHKIERLIKAKKE